MHGINDPYSTSAWCGPRQAAVARKSMVEVQLNGEKLGKREISKHIPVSKSGMADSGGGEAIPLIAKSEYDGV